MTAASKKQVATHEKLVRDDPAINPNSLHDFLLKKRGARNIPSTVRLLPYPKSVSKVEKNPGHPYSETKHVNFKFYDPRKSNAPFGYEYYVSTPPTYDSELGRTWPLILFLHGAGQSQRKPNESYASIRHGIPKLILCYDRFKDGLCHPHIDIPLPSVPRRSRQFLQGDNSVEPADEDVCTLLAESFITVTPSLNMIHGYGWNASILSALLDEVVDQYSVDRDSIHVTGFSMGGYGTWSLGMHSPNRFASLVPVCGGGDAARVSQIKHIPHWIHHGDLDDIIPLRASQQMYHALRKAKSGSVAGSEGLDPHRDEHLMFSRYPELLHDSWTAAYGSLELYKWMLNQRRRGTASTSRHVPAEDRTIVDDIKAASMQSY